ncbi:MAG: hypothetical protein GC181_10775 [Bacteroidetes bacterium]|nr:hypothetical protein [Bacteroidota bacterium]
MEIPQDIDLVELAAFARGKKQEIRKDSAKMALAYTRVSSKEQEMNLSLDVQMQSILNYAERRKIHIAGFFGGAESAKDDEREEFKRMLEFARRNKKKIGYILVHSLDRFSRSGPASMTLIESLQKDGIQVISVTQPTDLSPSGELMQQILLSFSNFDNKLRRTKTIDGMKERLKRGLFVGIAPIGYDYDRSQRHKPLVQTQAAPLIKKAFELKVQGMSNADIVKKLRPQGLDLHQKSMSKLFAQPLYAGFISNKLLEGELVKGSHPPIISKDLFLAANADRRQFESRISQSELSDLAPLRGFIWCSACMSHHLTAYEVKCRGLYYYKCSIKNCKHNIRLEQMHELFYNMLSSLVIDVKHIPTLQKKLRDTYNDKYRDHAATLSRLKGTISNQQGKLYELEERYAFGKITQEIFDRVSETYRQKLIQAESELFKLKTPFEGNFEDYLDFSLELSTNLHQMWRQGDTFEKVRLQNLVFPKGIIYDKAKNTCAPLTTNMILSGKQDNLLV